MLTARAFVRDGIVVHTPLWSMGAAAGGLLVADALGGWAPLLVTILTSVAYFGGSRWTVRRGDVFDTTAPGFRSRSVTLHDPEVVIRPVSGGKRVTTVISVVDGTDTNRVDVARFAPLPDRLTLWRAGRVARSFGTRFDEAGWRDWMHERRRPTARRL